MPLSKKLKQMLFEREITPTDLAKALDMPVPTIHRIVTGRTTRPHEKSIRAISSYFGIPTNELTEDDKHTPSTNKIRDVPLLEWEMLGTDIKTIKNKIAVGGVSDKAFAAIMPDHSMEPMIEKDSILIFDPQVDSTDRSYVLVKLLEPNVYVLRQLLIDLENSFIKSLNNDIGAKSLRLLTNNDAIIARLVEIRRKV
jgi:transcriptional regulator with XRE-family HTH domain